MSAPTLDEPPTCWQCSGTKVMNYLDRYGSGDVDVCDICNGTGKMPRKYT